MLSATFISAGSLEISLPISIIVIFSAIKAMVIHPATEKHIAKYTDHERYVVEETAELYNSVTLPHLLEQQFSVQVSAIKHYK